MAYTTIDDPFKFFNTVLWAGNSDSTRNITGVGFQPDFTWVKNRSLASDHRVADAANGANKGLVPNGNDQQDTSTTAVKSFLSDGIEIGNEQSFNRNGDNHVGWFWKAGTTSGLSGGTITPSAYSINTTSGFSVIKWAGTGSAGTIPHGLGKRPGTIFMKRLTAYAENWIIYHQKLNNGTNPEVKYLELNSTNAQLDSSSTFNDQPTTTSIFNVKDDGTTNASGSDYIAYCFADIKGYSKFGSFTGNNNADGTFVYTGFKPAWVMTKSFTQGGTGYDWVMFDNKRNPFNVSDAYIDANLNAAEVTSGRNEVDFLSNGFKCRSSYGDLNSNYQYIYMAFAENPFVTAGTKAAGTAK